MAATVLSRGARWGAVALLCATAGCTYLRNRGRDAADMGDFGLTFTRKPQLGLYMNCPVVVPIGYGRVDGYYAGVGAGKVGVMKHTQRNVGLGLWGKEQNTWTDGDETTPEAREDQSVGVLGLAEERKDKTPYKPACKHYFHLGWIGVTANIRWLEIPDFLLGWACLDISRDDRRDAPTPQADQEPKAPDTKEAGDGK